MSSTNKTTHYNLPQFIGSDIPTWLGDINSAMTEIDSGINAAATSAEQALTNAAAAQQSANDALEAANRCPFPIGFGGFFNHDPNSIYLGTTWKQKKDVFILAAGDTHPAGSTGGEEKHLLTRDEMPRHEHKGGSEAAPESSGELIDPWTMINLKSTGNNTGRYYTVVTTIAGGSQPHNNMPPYFAMPFWVRTA